MNCLSEMMIENQSIFDQINNAETWMDEFRHALRLENEDDYIEKEQADLLILINTTSNWLQILDEVSLLTEDVNPDTCRDERVYDERHSFVSLYPDCPVTP